MWAIVETLCYPFMLAITVIVAWVVVNAGDTLNSES